MAQPEGIQGRGQAGIFGGSISPLQIYLQHNAGRQKAQADQYEYERKKRDAILDETQKYAPHKTWEPMFQQVAQMAQKGREQTMAELSAGVPINKVRVNASRWQSDTDMAAEKALQLKSDFDSLHDRAKKDKYINYDSIKPEINDIFFNGMNGKDLNTIDTTNSDQIFSKSKHYNNNEIITDFMKDIPEKVHQHLTEVWDKLGQRFDIRDMPTKLGIEYTTDKNGNPAVVLDPRTGQPKIKMTDEVYSVALQNKYLQNILNDNLPPDANDQQKKQFLQKMMEGLDPATIKDSVHMGHKMDQNERWAMGGYSGRVNPQSLADRFKNTQDIVNGFRPDLLANTFSPFKEQTVQYVDSKGQKVTSQKDGKYLDENGNEVGKPTHIELKFIAKEDPLARMQAYVKYKVDEDGISDTERESRAKKAIESLGKKGEVKMKFDMNTVSGRRQWHEASNRILDEDLSIKDRLGEDYTKYVRDQYGDNASKGSIADQMKKAIKK
jgi:hypothetical protein